MAYFPIAGDHQSKIAAARTSKHQPDTTKIRLRCVFMAFNALAKLPCTLPKDHPKTNINYGRCIELRKMKGRKRRAPSCSARLLITSCQRAGPDLMASQRARNSFAVSGKGPRFGSIRWADSTSA
jgi:hypothetical protein